MKPQIHQYRPLNFPKKLSPSLTTFLNLSKANYLAPREEIDNEGFHILNHTINIKMFFNLASLARLKKKRNMIALPPINTDSQDNTTPLIPPCCDSSSGIYEQKFDDYQNVEESTYFMTSFVSRKRFI